MLHRKLALIATTALTSALAVAQSPVTNGFTYQGRLEQNNAPANGPFDFTFRLYDALSAGNPVGILVTANDVAVSNGTFTTSLDFGPAAFTGEARWLEIAVRPGASSGAYTPLTQRQPLTAAP